MNTNISTFDTMTSDIRGNNGWAQLKHVTLEPHRATTKPGIENIGPNSKEISAFCVGKSTDNLYYLYGLGVSGSDVHAWYKYDQSTNDWTSTGTFSGGTGTRIKEIAFHFEGKFYAFTTTAVTRWTPNSAFSATWHNTGHLYSSTYTTIAKPVIVGANAYFAMDNVVYELATGATSLVTKYTLSTDRLIYSISALPGNNLSVMTYHQGDQVTREFLFNVDGTDTNAYEQIDWGSGRVRHHTEVRGVVLAVVDERTTQYGDRNEASIKLKRRSGSQIVTDAELKCDIANAAYQSYSANTVIGNAMHMFENKLCCKVSYLTPLNERVSGILSYSTDGRFQIEVTAAFDSNNTYANLGFIQAYNSWFVAHSADTGFTTVAVTAPYNAGAYNITDANPANYYAALTHYDGVIQTRIINHGDSTSKKNLIGASVSFEPLSSTNSPYVKLYYRRPGDNDWTLLASQSTTGATSLDYVNSSHTVSDYKEIQFQILTRHASVTGFKEVSTLVKTQPYDTK